MIAIGLGLVFVSIGAMAWFFAAKQIATAANALIPERGHDADCEGCCSTCQSTSHGKRCESDVASS